MKGRGIGPGKNPLNLGEDRDQGIFNDFLKLQDRAFYWHFCLHLDNFSMCALWWTVNSNSNIDQRSEIWGLSSSGDASVSIWSQTVTLKRCIVNVLSVRCASNIFSLVNYFQNVCECVCLARMWVGVESFPVHSVIPTKRCFSCQFWAVSRFSSLPIVPADWHAWNLRSLCARKQKCIRCYQQSGTWGYERERYTAESLVTACLSLSWRNCPFHPLDSSVDHGNQRTEKKKPLRHHSLFFLETRGNLDSSIS